MARNKKGNRRGPSFAEMMAGKAAAEAKRAKQLEAFMLKVERMTRMPVAYSSIVGFVDEAIAAGVFSSRNDVVAEVRGHLKAQGFSRTIAQLAMTLWNEDHERTYGEEDLMSQVVVEAVQRLKAEAEAKKAADVVVPAVKRTHNKGGRRQHI